MKNEIHPLVLILVPVCLFAVVMIEHWASGKIEDAKKLLTSQGLLGQKMKLERVYAQHSRYHTTQFSIFSIEKDNTRVEIRKIHESKDLTEVPTLNPQILEDKTQIRVIKDKRVVYSRNFPWFDTVFSHVFKTVM